MKLVGKKWHTQRAHLNVLHMKIKLWKIIIFFQWFMQIKPKEAFQRNKKKTNTQICKFYEVHHCNMHRKLKLGDYVCLWRKSILVLRCMNEIVVVLNDSFKYVSPHVLFPQTHTEKATEKSP